MELGKPAAKPKPRWLLSPVLAQVFTLTFLAEWGDRSQITTIVLAVQHNFYGVCIGGILGHAICTGGAVLGGRLLAQQISVRTVTLLGTRTCFAEALTFCTALAPSLPHSLVHPTHMTAGGVIFLGCAAFALWQGPSV